MISVSLLPLLSVRFVGVILQIKFGDHVIHPAAFL